MLRGAWQMEGGVTSACAITCTPTCKCTCTCARVRVCDVCGVCGVCGVCVACACVWRVWRVWRVRARVYVHVHVCTFSCAEGDPGSSSLVTRESKCDKYIWFLVVCSAAQAKGFTGGAVVSQEGLANGRGDTTAASSQQLSSASKPSARSTQQQNPSETIGTSGSETGATSGQRERRHGWDDGSSHLYTRAATSGRILVPRLHAGPRVRNTCLGRCATRLPTRRQSAYYACPLGNPHLPLATGQHRPEPAPASHRPAPASTGQHRPTTSRQPPATSHQPPATSHQPPNDHRLEHYWHPPLSAPPTGAIPQSPCTANQGSSARHRPRPRTLWQQRAPWSARTIPPLAAACASHQRRHTLTAAVLLVDAQHNSRWRGWFVSRGWLQAAFMVAGVDDMWRRCEPNERAGPARVWWNLTPFEVRSLPRGDSGLIGGLNG